MIDGNGIERELGTIIAKLDAMEKKDENYRQDIKELYGSTGTNTTSVKAAHTRLDGMKEDVDSMKKKSAGIGGASGLGGGAIMAFLKDFFVGGN